MTNGNGLRDWLSGGYPGSELPGAEEDTIVEAGIRSAAQKLADDIERERAATSYRVRSPEISEPIVPSSSRMVAIAYKLKGISTIWIIVAVLAIVGLVLILRRSK